MNNVEKLKQKCIECKTEWIKNCGYDYDWKITEIVEWKYCKMMSGKDGCETTILISEEGGEPTEHLFYCEDCPYYLEHLVIDGDNDE